MTTIFLAIGEHRADPCRLLLLGDDGVVYEERLPDELPTPVSPDRRDWVIDRPHLLTVELTDQFETA